ncbi:methionyl-tRNA formyltransferase [Candidatus Sumerlaeota bacterium]|nr:methionyl-tRNA formyltransferase [Candidatus Sumerlaeota bacterium]
MKICFMGTPDFAVPTLQRLIESRHEVALAVTQPSKPKGRGQKIVDPPVKVIAHQHGIPVIQPASLKKEPIEDKIREHGIDVIVVVAYGKILPESLLKSPRIGCLNVHASLLPEYRGAAPIQRAILEGRLETGVTIMKVEPALDTGPIIAQQKMEIQPDDDALSVSHFLSVLGADLLLRVLDDIERSGTIEGVEQDHSLATHAAMLTKEEGRIPWDHTSEQIMFRLRAFTPWPGCFTMLAGKRMGVLQAEPLDSEEAAHNKLDDELPPGTVTGIIKGFGFTVRTGDGHLLVTQLQPEGKPAMDADAYLNGYPIKTGQKLGA